MFSDDNYTVSKLSYMKKREMGWHVLFYNIRRNIEFNGVRCRDDLSFFILIFGVWVTPDNVIIYINF